MSDDEGDMSKNRGPQTNRWIGYHLLKSHGVDLSASDPLCKSALAVPVPTDASTIHPVSPNQYGEAVALAWRNQPNNATKDQALWWFVAQRMGGHCTKAAACEVNTNSHWHIHGLWAASLLKTARARVRVGMEQAALDWWACELYLWRMLGVPRGPRAGQIIGVCGRWSGDGDSDTRDVCAALIAASGGDGGKGGQYWTRPALDTFASWLVKDLVREEAFVGLRPLKPILPPGLTITVEHYADGHRSTSSRPINKQGDGKPDPTCVAVKYSTGEVTTDGRAADVDLGEYERTEAV